MNTYTVFELNNNLQVRWYGGATFNVFRQSERGWQDWDVFSVMHIDNVKDATEFVESWYNDLVGTGEIEDYS